MTDNQSATRNILAFPAGTSSGLRDQIREATGAGAAAPAHPPHEDGTSYRPGERALPANQRWRMLAAMGGAAVIVIAIILSIAALLSTRAVGLVE